MYVFCVVEVYVPAMLFTLRLANFEKLFWYGLRKVLWAYSASLSYSFEALLTRARGCRYHRMRFRPWYVAQIVDCVIRMFLSTLDVRHVPSSIFGRLRTCKWMAVNTARDRRDRLNFSMRNAIYKSGHYISRPLRRGSLILHARQRFHLRDIFSWAMMMISLVAIIYLTAGKYFFTPSEFREDSGFCLPDRQYARTFYGSARVFYIMKIIHRSKRPSACWRQVQPERRSGINGFEPGRLLEAF